ncbi:hypothetical protein EV2_025933 [Malus domestica]
MNSICPACPYDLKIIRVVTPAVLPAVGRAPYKRKGNHCYLCWFVRMDMMDLLPRLELASATLGFEALYLGEVMAGNSNFFWLYTSPSPLPVQ